MASVRMEQWRNDRQQQNEVWVSTKAVNELDNGQLTHYNLVDANYRRKPLGPNERNQHNVLHQITALRTSTR